MKNTMLATIAAVLLFASSQAHAVTYLLDQNNAGLTGGPWGSVTLTDTTYQSGNNNYDAVKFVVAPFQNAFTEGSNFGLQDFRFNENTGLSQFKETVGVYSSSDWDWNYSASAQFGGPYGKFEFLYSGKGNSRVSPLEFYLFSLLDEFDIKADQFAVPNSDNKYIFAAHIAGFEDAFDEEGKPVTSGIFATDGTPVPEPGSFALLGAGLLGLALYRRRTGN